MVSKSAEKTLKILVDYVERKPKGLGLSGRNIGRLHEGKSIHGNYASDVMSEQVHSDLLSLQRTGLIKRGFGNTNVKRYFPTEKGIKLRGTL